MSSNNEKFPVLTREQLVKGNMPGIHTVSEKSLPGFKLVNCTIKAKDSWWKPSRYSNDDIINFKMVNCRIKAKAKDSWWKSALYSNDDIINKKCIMKGSIPVGSTVVRLSKNEGYRSGNVSDTLITDKYTANKIDPKQPDYNNRKQQVLKAWSIHGYGENYEYKQGNTYHTPLNLPPIPAGNSLESFFFLTEKDAINSHELPSPFKYLFISKEMLLSEWNIPNTNRDIYRKSFNHTKGPPFNPRLKFNEFNPRPKPE